MANKDLETVWKRYPELLKKYDPELNDGKQPPEIFSKNSPKTFVWKCYECGSIYKTTVKSEIRKMTFKHSEGRCDVCRSSIVHKHIKTGFIEHKGTKSIKDINDLVKTDPNTEWECEKHGKFKMSVVNAQKLIQRDDYICPECRKENRIVMTVAEYAPHLVKEWDPNNKLSPYEVTYGSKSIVSWICSKCGHHWNREVKARTTLNRGCPECNHKVRRFADVYPHLKKNFSLENDFPFEQEALWSTKKALWICDNGHKSTHTFDLIVKTLTRYGRSFPCPVCSNQIKQVGFNSLFDIHPELKDQWDYEANAKEGLDPNTIGVMYNDHPVHLRCIKYKHPYTLRLDRKYEYDDAGRESCPYCDGREAYAGYNDLTTTEPELAKEYSINNERPVTTVMKSMAMRSLWNCSTCNGEYFYPINLREYGDDSCPYCADKRVLAGLNDLATTHPELVKEYSINNDRLIETVKKDMKLKLLWTCPTCDGEYSYSVNDREVGDDSCPYCANKKPLRGFNTLKAKYPELMQYWDYEGNVLKGIDPDNELPSSSKKARWKCYDCGTAYKMIISDRVLKLRRKQNPCNCCNGRVRNKLFI